MARARRPSSHNRRAAAKKAAFNRKHPRKADGTFKRKSRAKKSSRRSRR